MKRIIKRSIYYWLLSLVIPLVFSIVFLFGFFSGDEECLKILYKILNEYFISGKVLGYSIWKWHILYLVITTYIAYKKE